MAKRRYEEQNPHEEGFQELFGADSADQAFWDEFWRLEASGDEEAPLVTITIRNEETGEERVIEKVRLRFRSSRRLLG